MVFRPGTVAASARGQGLRHRPWARWSNWSAKRRAACAAAVDMGPATFRSLSRVAARLTNVCSLVGGGFMSNGSSVVSNSWAASAMTASFSV